MEDLIEDAKPEATARMTSLMTLRPARGKVTHDEIEEAIRAYRRGVSFKRIAARLGRGDLNLRAVIGTWALRNAVIPESR